MSVRLEMKSPKRIAARMGIDPSGDIQRFHTNNVMRRMVKYMPYRSGATIKLMIAQTDISKPLIILRAPYARVIYHGNKMVDAATGSGPAMIPDVGPRFRRGSQLKPTNIPLEYTKTKNPQAGPYWDRRLVAAEMPAMTQDLQRYIKSKEGKT